MDAACKSICSCYNKCMTKSIPITQWAKWLAPRTKLWPYIAGLVILLVSALVWWFGVQTQPQRVFQGMLEQSLKTSGVTMNALQDNNGSEVDYTLQYSLGAEPRAHSIVKINQPGVRVVTETIGTQEADFTRYLDIETDQVGEDGQPLDTSNIEGVWARDDNNQESLIGQALLGLSLPLGAWPVPIAGLEPEARQELLTQIANDNVYEVDYGNVEKNRQDGRLRYTYSVNIQVILYASMMKTFAAHAGLHEFADLDPNQYSGSPPLEVQLTVDVRSRNLIEVRLPAQAEGEPEYVQTFSGHGIPADVSTPEDYITNAELQQRLQEL